MLHLDKSSLCIIKTCVWHIVEYFVFHDVHLTRSTKNYHDRIGSSFVILYRSLVKGTLWLCWIFRACHQWLSGIDHQSKTDDVRVDVQHTRTLAHVPYIYIYYIYITHLKLYIHLFPHVRGAHDLPHLAPPNVERFLIIRDSLGCNTHTAEHLESNCWYRLWIWMYLQKWVVIISNLPRHILNDFTTCITAV